MKTQLLKKWEISMLLALCITLCAGVWASARSAALSGSLVRLHVVAVSDDAEEQAIKLRVRDSVLAYLEPRLEGVQDAAGARELIGSELDGIRSAAETAAEGREVSVTLGREYYPTRDYGTFALPAGSYESLRVVLGEGRGHNWWCVVFPPLCLSAAETESALETLGGDNAQLLSGEGEGVVFKFRLLELWGELMEYLGLD